MVPECDTEKYDIQVTSRPWHSVLTEMNVPIRFLSIWEFGVEKKLGFATGPGISYCSINRRKPYYYRSSDRYLRFGNVEAEPGPEP